MRIVVGVDRSEGAAAALRVALHEAAAHRTGVDAVTAWESPSEPSYEDAGHRACRAAARQAALETAQQVVAEVRARAGPGSPPVSVREVHGPALEVLLAVSSEADLLVVGRGGGGVLRWALLGSVSGGLVRSAHCPVVVVPVPHAHQPGRAAGRSRG